MDDIGVAYLTEDKVQADILVEGLPGIGQVGKLVVEHMIQELGAEKIVDIISVFLPPQVLIDPGGVVRLPANEIYLWKGEEKSIAFLIGDFQSTSNEGHYLLADAYLDVAEELGVKRVYTLGGFGVGHLVEEPRVLGAVNDEKLIEEVTEAGGVMAGDEPGGIVGAAGLLLGLATERGMDGICLMGETPGYLVDPKSAGGVLAVLTRLLGVEVDPTQLAVHAAEMEKILARYEEMERGKEEESLNYIG
ncbi:proteasome assembly chaperone family protein [Methanofollis aquaemaris]|uniref:Proteasome assembly chaperone family protein n=1 Tax=Methanofollis aquaemaris TaxID=126734 RepID=A0A8A3S3W3_9EURY|nr:proteasome assembly chaperone family protein [Methanofollis aquaemaris]QSZ66825.1 proteasome assembly chaperone family protein [Methanofollis aquaemaris]